MAKSLAQAEELKAQLKARTPVIVIRTSEEVRVEGFVFEACAAAKYLPRTWDCAAGPCELDGTPFMRIESNGPRDPLSPPPPPGVDDVLRYVRAVAMGEESPDRCAWILRDVHKWVDGPIGMVTARALRNMARMLPGVRDPRQWQAIICIIPVDAVIPPDLEPDVVILDWPLPDREEIASILDRIARDHSVDLNGLRDPCIDAAVGMTGLEAEGCYSKSLVQTRTIDPAVVAQEKKRIIGKDKVLQWMDPLPGGFDVVGGLDNIKDWVNGRVIAYTQKARAYGLKALKGLFLCGISGCGKTYIAKAVAWALGQVPLIRLDLGAAKSKFVGDSEAGLRKAFAQIESIGKCVILIDEIEKALEGAVSGSADGGVSADALGAFLTWMQERKSEALVIATANDISKLPPEMLRKGRWDELFWVDLPTAGERREILQATLRTNGRDHSKLPYGGFATVEAAWDAVTKATDKFTGAEVAQLVPEALFAGFADGERLITFQDLVDAAEAIVPLAETAKKKIDAMRADAKGRMRMATKPDAQAFVTPSGRVLDIA